MENRRSAILLIFVLITVILAACYYYLVMPKKEELASKQASIYSLEGEVATLDEQLAMLETEGEVFQDGEYNLRKKVPDNRAIDQILLAIQEMELVTNSKVDNIAFNNYDDIVAESNLLVIEDEEDTEETTNQTTEEAPVSPIVLEAVPPSLKLITLSLDVRSENFDSLKLFLKEIEELERVTRIDSLDFGLPGESKEFEEDASDVTSASIQITTFFYDGE